MIRTLKKNQIFVFGSNLAGKHGAGAALQAKRDFGAEEGIAEGLTGQCYAFPTLSAHLRQRSHTSLIHSRRKFFRIVREHPDKQFLLTKVGCGIAGYPEPYMKSFFRAAPKNVTKPKDW